MAEELIVPSPEESLPEIQSIVTLSRKYIPKMELGSQKAVAALKEITEENIGDDEDLEDVTEILALARDAYNKINEMRTEMTKPLDQLKKKFMEYERPLSDDKDSEYTRVRGVVAKYNQKKIDEKKRIADEAAKKKARENHLVDIGTQILQNLNTLILTKTKEAETQSKTYFDKSTLADFDTRAEAYRKMKPGLKIDEYSKCFAIDYNKSLFTPSEYADIIATIKQVETYEKWTEEIIKAATPVINAWRAKISELKQNLIDLKNASDESERKRLADEQARKAQEETERRLREAEQQNLSQSLDISTQASNAKLENEFVEQITTQQAGETGPVKYVLKFTDQKLIMKALTTIIYHSMAHKDFPGVEKKKDGKIVRDAQGNTEYIPAVKWWVDFFMANCDAAIPGTEVIEVAKVIIRK